jgi:superoxide dismutase, Cu-Zn family
MALRRTLTLAIAPALLAACMVMPVDQPIVTSNLIRSDGASIGSVRVFPQTTGVLLRISAHGLPPGLHGVHVHAVGRCDPPRFDSAAAHWNPTGRQHGHQNPAGWHSGDLGNLGVGTDGKLVAGLLVPGASLAALRDADGSAFVIHSRPDDERTDPGGNSGDRIACAVL